MPLHEARDIPTPVEPTSDFSLDRSPTVRYVNVRARTIAIIVTAELLLVLLIGVVHSQGAPKKVLASCALLALLAAMRSACGFVLVLGRHGVCMRTLTRTSYWRYHELQQARIVTRADIASREIVLIEPRNGHPSVVTRLEETPSVPSPFEGAVAEINARIMAAHHDG
jgi:hypothetical protein